MIEQKILAVKIKAKGVVEYLRRPQVRQYENNATVIWAWFEEVGIAESITAKLHYELPDGETLTPEQLFTAYTTTEDLINDIPNTKGYGDVVIPSGTKIYTYPIPQGMTTIDGELKYNIVAYLSDDSIFVSQQDKITINKSTPPTGTFVPDVIDSTLEALLASKTDLTDFNALRDGSLGFTLIDLDGHTIDWNDLAGTVQIELQNGVVLDTGLEVLKFGRASGSISDGTPAQFVKYQGQRPIFKTPVAVEVNDNPHTVRVLATQDFTNNQDGYFTRFGNVRNINTMGYLLPGEDANNETTWGDTRLWYDPVTNGLTRTRPSSPNAKISMGYVTRFHSTQGVIDTDVVVYPKFSELQDVQNGATDGQVWVYDSALGLTKPSSRLTSLEEQVLSIGGVENSAVDKVNDLLLDYADNVKMQGASATIIADTSSVDITSTTDVNIISGVDTHLIATGEMFVDSGDDMTFSAVGDGYFNSNQYLYLYGASGIDLYSDGNITLGGLEIQVNGTLQVNGDIVQNGASYETHAEQVYTTQNTIILRDGAVAGLGTGEWVGIVARIADGTNDAQILINGSGEVRIGDAGDTQAVATRQDSPIANGVAYWNATDKRFDTHSNMTYRTADNSLRANLFSSPQGIVADGGSVNAYINTSNNGTVISRNIADANPALKVNLANAGATGNIAEFQAGGVSQASINKTGDYSGRYAFLTGGLSNPTSVNNSRVNVGDTGVLIQRNINDANPALTVNEQQGTGDILRLQYGGANTLIVDRLGKINKTQVNADYLLENGTRLLSTFNYGNNGTVTTDGNNIFLGNAGNSTMGSTATQTTHASYNIGVGNNALLNNTTGNNNHAIGNNALRFNTTGYNNSAVGFAALYSNTTGSSNIAVGLYAGRFISDGTTGNATGSNNTFIGSETKAGATQGLSNSTALGYQAYFDASNQMVFGNASVSEFKFNRNSASVAKFANIQVDGDIISTKSAVDYTETYSNPISSTYGDIVPYKDGTPLVTEISGRTMPVVSQLVTNGDFSSGTTGWTSYGGVSTVSGGILSNTANGTELYNVNYQDILVSGTKYYINSKVRVTNSSALIIRVRSANNSILITQSSPTINQWYNLSVVGTTTVNRFEIRTEYADSTTANGKITEIDYGYVFNVSDLISNKTYSPLYNKTFDLMSDAEIKAQMDEWVQTNKIPTSVVAHLENTTLKSTGKNLLPNEWEQGAYDVSGVKTASNFRIRLANLIRVKPSTTYTFRIESPYSIAVRGYDINGVFVRSIGSPSSFTLLSNEHYVSITVYYNDIQLITPSMVDTIKPQLEQGSTATAYTPYKSETQSFVHGRLSRLPNNVSDKIRYDNGKYVLDRYVQEYKISPTPTTPTISSKDMYRVQVTLPATPIDWTASSTHPILFSSVQGTLIKYGVWSSVPTSSYGWAIYTDGVNRYIDVVIPIGSTFATVMGEITIYYQLATPLLATQTIDVDGTLIQDSVTTIEQTQALATEYDVKFAINAEQTVVNLVDKDKIQQEVIDANEQKLEPITNGSYLDVTKSISIQTTEPKLHLIDTNNDSDYYIANANGTFQIYDSTNDTVRMSIASDGDVSIYKGGTLLAGGDTHLSTYTVSALSNYKYIELIADVFGQKSSAKVPSSILTNGSYISCVVAYYTGELNTDYELMPVNIKVNNAGLTEVKLYYNDSSYDAVFYLYGWNY